MKLPTNKTLLKIMDKLKRSSRFRNKNHMKLIAILKSPEILKLRNGRMKYGGTILGAFNGHMKIDLNMNQINIILLISLARVGAIIKLKLDLILNQVKV